MNLLERLEKIEEHVLLLHERCKSLEEENASLLVEKQALQEKLSSNQDLINNLEEQNKISKLAGGLTGESDQSELKNQIDDLIAEIDQCIKIVKS